MGERGDEGKRGEIGEKGYKRVTEGQNILGGNKI